VFFYYEDESCHKMSQVPAPLHLSCPDKCFSG